jgi:hypothetical protein
MQTYRAVDVQIHVFLYNMISNCQMNFSVTAMPFKRPRIPLYAWYIYCVAFPVRLSPLQLEIQFKAIYGIAKNLITKASLHNYGI